MNKDIIKGNWTELKGKVLKQWGKLTNDDLDVIDGSRQELRGKIEKLYGLKREEAEKQILAFEADCRC